MKFPKYKSRRCIVYADFADRQNKNALTEENSVNAYVQENKLCCAKNITKISDETCYGALDIADNGIVYCGSGGLHFQKNDVTHIMSGVVLTKPCIAYSATSGYVFVSQVGAGTYLHADAWAKVNDLGFDTMAFFNERFLAVSQNKLYFTYCGSSDWEGSLSFPCELSAVAVLQNKLYVFGQDLFQVDFDAKTTNTKITTVCNNIGKVYPKTAVASGNKIFFFTPKGLCCFSESSVKQILLNTFVCSDNSDSTAAVFDGNYYLSYSAQNQKACNRVVKVDCDSLNPVTYFDISASFLLGGKRLLLGSKNKLYTFSEDSSQMVWTSKRFDFGVSCKKFLKQLQIQAEGDVQVRLITEKEEKVYSFEKSGKLQKVNIHGVFERLNVEIKSNGAVSQFAVVAQVPTQSEVKYGSYNR